MWAATHSGLVRGNDLGHPEGVGGILFTPFLSNGTALLRAFFIEKNGVPVSFSRNTAYTFCFLAFGGTERSSPYLHISADCCRTSPLSMSSVLFYFYSAKKLPFGSTTMFFFLPKFSPQLNVEQNPIVGYPTGRGRRKHPAFGFFLSKKAAGIGTRTLCRFGKWLLAEPKKKGHKKEPAFGQKGLTKKQTGDEKKKKNTGGFSFGRLKPSKKNRTTPVVYAATQYMSQCSVAQMFCTQLWAKNQSPNLDTQEKKTK